MTQAVVAAAASTAPATMSRVNRRRNLERRTPGSADQMRREQDSSLKARQRKSFYQFMESKTARKHDVLIRSARLDDPFRFVELSQHGDFAVLRRCLQQAYGFVAAPLHRISVRFGGPAGDREQNAGV